MWYGRVIFKGNRNDLLKERKMKNSALVIWIILILACGAGFAQAPPPLTGFVDMHTHPVSQLGFGEQLFYGDNDGPINIALGSCHCVHNFDAFVGICSSSNLYRNQMV